MALKVDQNKRSFIKKMLLAAGTALVVGSRAKASKQVQNPPADEVLYRETEAFRAYYESLKR